MTTMKNWSALAPSASSVSIRFLSSTALSSWAVPSVASRSSSVLTTPWTNSRARRSAMIRRDDDEQDRHDLVAHEVGDVAPGSLGRSPASRHSLACRRSGRQPVRRRPPPSRTEMAAAASRAWAASSGMRRGVSRKAGPQMSTAAMTLPRASWTGAATALSPSSYSPIAVA